MRILHTSDWHLGRTLNQVDLLQHQRAFATAIADIVRERDVDVVIIAGDIYDRAMPSVEAVSILSQALADLAEHATVIVTSGNHDSATRLGFGAAFMRPQVRLRTDLNRIGEPDLIEHVAFYPLPYLDPDMARPFLETDEGWVRSHEWVLTEAMRRIRADLAGRDGMRSVVIGHAFVAGGAPSESERDIQVGGVQVVPAGLFDGIDYVALGHLHGPQRILAGVAPDTHVRYAGSPLAYSFSEVNHTKSVALIDLPEQGPLSVELIAMPVPRPLAIVRGTFDEVMGAVGEPFREHWVRIEITDTERPVQLGTRLKERFPHMLQHHFAFAGAQPSVVPRISAAASPVEVGTQFLEYAGGRPPTDDEVAVLADVFTAVSKAGA